MFYGFGALWGSFRVRFFYLEALASKTILFGLRGQTVVSDLKKCCRGDGFQKAVALIFDKIVFVV